MRKPHLAPRYIDRRLAPPDSGRSDHHDRFDVARDKLGVLFVPDDMNGRRLGIKEDRGQVQSIIAGESESKELAGLCGNQSCGATAIVAHV